MYTRTYSNYMMWYPGSTCCCFCVHLHSWIYKIILVLHNKIKIKHRCTFFRILIFSQQKLLRTYRPLHNENNGSLICITCSSNHCNLQKYFENFFHSQKNYSVLYLTWAVLYLAWVLFTFLLKGTESSVVMLKEFLGFFGSKDQNSIISIVSSRCFFKDL